MSRTIRLIAASALASATVAAPAVAHARPTGPAAPVAKAPVTAGFTPVRTTSYAATSVAATARDGVVVVGTRSSTPGAAGAVVVEEQRNGRWTTQTLPGVTATGAQVVSATDKQQWILTIGETPMLWRSQGNHYVKVAQPTMPAGITQWSPWAIAAEGGTVVLWGSSFSQARGTQATSARLTGGRWTVTPFSSQPGGQSRQGVPPLAGLAQGRFVATVSFMGGHVWSTAYDLTATPPRVLGATHVFHPTGEEWRTSDWVVRSAADITTWGSQRTWTDATFTRQSLRGLCKRLVNGATATCPAPAWVVTAATALPDGRQVIGGEDTVPWRHQDGSTGPVVQGGFAVVTGQSTPVPVAGDPGDAVVDLVARSTVTWAITRTGTTTTIQRAVLPAASTAKVAAPR
ncbi:hypothetical protein, partial [uncultured Arsenicicoccus sp.]|uniref:hypothetical protein n=1 Tax=uncultured Arsenicicoccus sp. TaxID=491339 RepID=UPI00259904B9